MLIVATGWNNRGALASSRALAKAGWEIGCATGDLKGLLATSRSISRLHPTLPPTADLDGFLEGIATALRSSSYEAVLRDAMDGSGDRRVGRRQGPVVVKVRCHWRPDSVGMPGRWRTYVCGDRVEARRRNPRYAPPWRPSTPGVVRGPLLHCHVLVDRSADLVVAVQQRSELVAKITVLLRRLGWFGFVGLMFIVGADGVPQLVDFNGRIPMSFQQSIAACPQLPDLWARVAAGRSPDQAVTSWSRR